MNESEMLLNCETKEKETECAWVEKNKKQIQYEKFALNQKQTKYLVQYFGR